jgi:4-hydroxy-L-threonine phosphate dehydrogenase PdxA
LNRNFESVLRFVNLTTAGLLAGSLGFGEAALVPGWQEELPRNRSNVIEALRHLNYYNAIGPVALGTAVTLAVGTRNNAAKRLLDAASAVALAGVLAATIMVTVPINKELEEQAPTDYPSDRSLEMSKNWARAHAVRTTLGISAFVCAVASGVAGRRS